MTTKRDDSDDIVRPKGSMAVYRSRHGGGGPITVVVTEDLHRWMRFATIKIPRVKDEKSVYAGELEDLATT